MPKRARHSTENENAHTPRKTPRKESSGRESRDNGDYAASSSQSSVRQPILNGKPAGGVPLKDGNDQTSLEYLATNRAEADEVDDQSSSEEHGPEVEDELQPQEAAAVTPKRGRGRPKGSKKQRTPTPPPDIPAHERYFFHNRPTAAQTSTNTLPAHVLLNHEDYKIQLQTVQDGHLGDIERLKLLHRRSFEQWRFELGEQFNICLYGFGSKRDLLMQFAEELHSSVAMPTIVVVNGYTYGLNAKDILATLASQLFHREKLLPAQPSALADTILDALNTSNKHIYLLIHELDSTSMRRASIQTMMARLGSHPKISLICTCDNPNFGLLWDLNLLRQFNFVFHDATTFDAWSYEFDAVEEVNSLLGRSSRRLAGKDGVGYVLKSLPENARNLFRMLVAEQLAAGFANDAAQKRLEDDMNLDASDDDRAVLQQNTPSRRGRGRPPQLAKLAMPVGKSASKLAANVDGIEYRTLYHKAVEAFICSSEVNFRTLLKEFHDHQMIESRKDAMGTEKLIVPFANDDLEAILGEL